MNFSFVRTLSKSRRNGLAAESTILWAGKLRPPADRVTSTRLPWLRNCCTEVAKHELKSPHVKLYNWLLTFDLSPEHEK
jgi:hypothetical protein